MTFRNCFAANILFCILASLAVAQGTPGGKTPVFTGFIPLSEQQLQEGYLRPFNKVDMFGWKNAMLNDGKLHFTGAVADTPFFFLGYGAVPRNIFTDMDADRPKGIKTQLFDGKTLAGWTLRDKAEAVVVDGVIRLTNGSGSLESESKYGDGKDLG